VVHLKCNKTDSRISICQYVFKKHVLGCLNISLSVRGEICNNYLWHFNHCNGDMLLCHIPKLRHTITWIRSIQVKSCHCFIHLWEKFKSDNSVVESSWNLMAHGDAREGKWRGNWRMEWVASTLTLLWNTVYPALLPLMRTPRLPVVDWTDTTANLNGLVRFAKRPNLVSARVPSHFKRSLIIELVY
jgi:hypothetical protein